MPKKDHTGPEAQRPMTGRNLGDRKDKKKPPARKKKPCGGHGRNQSGSGLRKRRGRGFERRQ